MNADQLFEFYFNTIIYDVNQYAPEAEKIVQRYLKKIDTLIGATNSKDKLKMQTLVQFRQSVDEYLKAIQEYTSTCGLRTVLKSKYIEHNKHDADVFRLLDGLEEELKVYSDSNDDLFNSEGRHVIVLLAFKDDLRKQFLKKMDVKAMKCKALGRIADSNWDEAYDTI